MNTTMTTTKNDKKGSDQQLAHSNGSNGSKQEVTGSVFTPRFDIWEGDDELILYGDLPGVDPNHLDIHFENRQLTVHGRVSRRCGGDGYLYSEYGVGDFHRTFTVGESINADAINATLKDGVLTLHLPKADEAKSRRIEVNVA